MKMKSIKTLLFLLNLYFINAQPGSIDTTFNSTDIGFGNGDGLVGSSVFTTSIQSDGKIIFGGVFTFYNGTSRRRIARLHADGSLDASFNPGTGANDAVRASSIQSDGKIIIGGSFTSYNGTDRNHIARLHADGSLDASFNQGTGANGDVYTTSIQSDGKIIIGGSFTSYNGISSRYIARLHADGNLDASFNPGTGANGRVYSTSIQSDGKIIIGGMFDSYNGTPRNYIARLHADGSLDASFNSETGANWTVYSTSIQSDGKIIIGGGFTSYNGISSRYIARLHADGSLDASFDPGTGANDYVRTSSIQSDGKIIIGGMFDSYNGTPRNYIARLHSDGSLDASFDPGTGASSAVSSISIQSDGKIIIGGGFTSYNGTDRNHIARLHADGSLDASFNSGTGADSAVHTTSIQSDGKIIIGGDFSSYNGTLINRIARLHADGSLDASFNPGTGASSVVRTISIQSDGKIIIGGDFSSYNGTLINRIARLHADGSLDASFNPGTGANGGVHTTSIQSDGKIIIGGNFFSYGGTGINRIVRLHADGSLDASFNPGTGANYSVGTTSIQSDGKIIIGGAFTSYNGTPRNYITRLNTDGSLDASFNQGTGAIGNVITTSIQSDGKIIIGGGFTIYNGTHINRIARLHADGSLDASFNPESGPNILVSSTSIQSDGKIIIGGAFTSYNGTPRNYIARLNTDGSLDASFNPGTGASSVVRTISIQSDGKIIIGGEFTSYNGIGRNRIARILICPTSSTHTVTACNSFTWIDGNTYTTSNNTSSYTFFGAASNGCDSIVHLDLTILPILESSILINSSVPDNTICSGNSVSFTSEVENQGTNPIYSWKVNGTTVSASSNFSSSSFQDNDIITCELTSNEFCLTQETVLSNSITINVNPNPVISIANFTNTSTCDNNDGSFVIDGSGSGTLTWTGTNPGTQNVTLPTTISGLTAGSYSFTYNNGCNSNTVSSVIEDPNAPATPVVNNSGTSTFCEGQTRTLTSSISSNIVWSTGETTQSIVVSESGSYSVAHTVNGCTSISNIVSITVNSLPTPAVISANGETTFCNGASVVLSSNLASGNVWSTGATSQSITVTSSGNYSVTTAASGCTSTSNVISVVVNAVPTIALGGVTNVSTCGGTNGKIDVLGSGAGTVSWTGAASGSLSGTLPLQIQNLIPGSYTVTFNNGCNSNTLSATIGEPTPPTAPTITASGATTFCQGGTVTLSSSATTGNVWSTGATTQSITVNQSGDYSTTITSSPGCSATSNNIAVTVNAVPTTPTISANGPTTFCEGGNVILSSSSTTNNTWTGGSTNQNLTVSSSGTYSVTVTQNGCSATSTPISVTVNAIPTAPVITANGSTSFCEGESVTLTSNVNNGILWSTGATGSSIVVTSTGSFSVTRTVNGCSSTSNTITTSVNPVPNASIASITNVCDTASAFTLTQGSPAGGTYTVNGVSATEFIPSVSNIGQNTVSYTVTQNGCSATASTSFNVLNCSGVGLGENSLAIKLFPNPTTGMLYITGVDASEIVSIELFDEVGRLVLKTTETETIDLNNYANGMYQLVIKATSFESMQKIQLMK
jgi:uncharacterized delta-60 repeat protein